MSKNTLISILLFVFFIACKNGNIKTDKLQIQIFENEININPFNPNWRYFPKK